MKNKKASLIINPRLGNNVAKLQDILPIFSAAGWKTDIALKEYGKQVLQLSHQAASDKKDIVIAYGGDGTLNQVINGILSSKKYPSLVGLIPGGTANVWAGEVGIPTDPVKAALSLVDSEVRPVDVGSIYLDSITFPGEQPQSLLHKSKSKLLKESEKLRHHFLLMAGLGLDAAIMGNVSQPLKYHIGALAVGLSAAKSLPSQQPFPIEIRTADADAPIWKGEGLQVIVSNTRRYAAVADVNPDGHVDDGVLDVCVITGGDPLNTMQQVISVLAHRSADTTSAEYLHGAHLRITVPSNVLFQLDGSAAKLKDYLPSSLSKKVQSFAHPEQIQITYRIDVLPHVLNMAVPSAYNDTLFEHPPVENEVEPQTEHSYEQSHDPALEDHIQQEQAQQHSSPFNFFHRHKDEPDETVSQQQTAVVEAKPASELAEKAHGEVPQEDDHEQHDQQETKESLSSISSLLEDGRKITVVGKAPLASHPHTYIIAGHLHKRSVDDTVPAAVVVDAHTTGFDRDGAPITNLESALAELHADAQIVVEGKRTKRNVIHAKRVVL